MTRDKSRLRDRGVGQLAIDPVFRSIHFWDDQRAPWIRIASLLFFGAIWWGAAATPGMVAWSLAAIGYATYVSVKVWKPWRMPVYELLEGRSLESLDESPLGREVLRRLRRPIMRLTAGLLTATAALTPWVISATTRAFGAHSWSKYPLERMPAWLFVAAGLGDSAIAGLLAIKYMTTILLREEPELVDKAKRLSNAELAGERGHEFLKLD